MTRRDPEHFKVIPAPFLTQQCTLGSMEVVRPAGSRLDQDLRGGALPPETWCSALGWDVSPQGRFCVLGPSSVVVASTAPGQC